MGEKKIDTEAERESRLAKVIVDAMHAKMAEGAIPKEKHDEDHEFIAKLRNDDEQRKKWRLAIIEKVVTTVAGSIVIGILVFVGSAVWSAIKVGLK
ncbi:hypothetical protein [Undibacterium crateris]|uniref:hypothetical protein n=1 Tax=Undibacterium crateris TaxID=2528175 RepID=UPI00138A445C|nr:hypothetical protein [Undibacterium crateris]NDI85050.1 hypothetical protein [Undibacterium crateris]